MDRMRIERGVQEELIIVEEEDEEVINIIEEGDYYSCVPKGKVTLKMIANEIYGDESYWKLIYNNNDNKDVFKKVMEDNDLSLFEFVNNPIYLSGIRVILPRELEFYSDEFDTTTLKKVS